MNGFYGGEERFLILSKDGLLYLNAAGRTLEKVSPKELVNAYLERARERYLTAAFVPLDSIPPAVSWLTNEPWIHCDTADWKSRIHTVKRRH